LCLFLYILNYIFPENACKTAFKIEPTYFFFPFIRLFFVFFQEGIELRLIMRWE